jgi:hypothetical protein
VSFVDMTEIINKISSYNLFNYLLPGILFVVITTKFTKYSLLQDNIIIGAFVYYFVGLVISRFGSLVVEPILKKIKFLNFADYKDYISASKKDQKIEVLSEGNNTYRTLIAMLILVIFLKMYEWVEYKFPMVKSWSLYILILLLLVMFLYAYKKQTAYITKRVKVNN